MIIIDNVCLSDDIATGYFACDLQKCKGACCEEGDSGAPLEKEECELINTLLPTILPTLPAKNQENIQLYGFHTVDSEGDLTTTTIEGKECVFAVKKNNTWTCSFENLHAAGKIGFKKPISCHLYPIRLRSTQHFELVNYHRWHICTDACTLGEHKKIPLYIFLKEALVRKFGEPWYRKLCETIQIQTSKRA